MSIPGLARAFLAAAFMVLGALAARAQAPASAEPAPTVSDADSEPEVLIILKDGRRVSGLLVERSDAAIHVRVAGIVARFTPGEIESFQTLPPVLERYTNLREAVGDEPDQIIRLAEWLQARERYELAYSEVQRALALDPGHDRAAHLKTLLEQQIILKHRSARSPGGQTPAPAIARPGGGAIKPGEFPVLTHEQINLIKVFELNLAEAPRIIIPREAVEDMLERYAGHPLVPVTREGRDAIARRQPEDVLDLMFRLHARDFYGRVQVLDQPQSMIRFRDSVARNWLTNSCATAQCHGGLEAGRLVLLTRRPGAEPTLYTNYLILDRFRTRSGQPLIDWDAPERSILLHIGLPRKDSLFPHPEVPRGENSRDAWKPVFRSTSDRSFEEAVAWIKSMYRPHPDYPVEYTPIRPLALQPTPAPAPPVPPAPSEAPPSRPPETPPPSR